MVLIISFARTLGSGQKLSKQADHFTARSLAQSGGYDRYFSGQTLTTKPGQENRSKIIKELRAGATLLKATLFGFHCSC